MADAPITATYRGPGRGRTLPDGRRAEPGEPVEVDLDLGTALARQSVWGVDGLPEPDVVPDKVDDVKAWVGEDVDRARQALETEQAKDEDDRRSTLVTHLEQLLEGPDAGDAGVITDPDQE